MFGEGKSNRRNRGGKGAGTFSPSTNGGLSRTLTQNGLAKRTRGGNKWAPTARPITWTRSNCVHKISQNEGLQIKQIKQKKASTGHHPESKQQSPNSSRHAREGQLTNNSLTKTNVLPRLLCQHHCRWVAVQSPTVIVGLYRFVCLINMALTFWRERGMDRKLLQSTIPALRMPRQRTRSVVWGINLWLQHWVHRKRWQPYGIRVSNCRATEQNSVMERTQLLSEEKWEALSLPPPASVNLFTKSATEIHCKCLRIRFVQLFSKAGKKTVKVIRMYRYVSV